MIITEEDLVDKTLFDEIISEIKNKFDAKKDLWQDELVRD